jgi:hypothetical protein
VEVTAIPVRDMSLIHDAVGHAPMGVPFSPMPAMPRMPLGTAFPQEGGYPQSMVGHSAAAGR